MPETKSTVVGAAPEGASDRNSAARAVREMFTSIAPRYDLLNHVLSMNVDRLWWRRTARSFRHIVSRGDARVLDSSGTLCTNPAMKAPNPCYSRAQVFQLDENGKVAELSWQSLPGYLSIWGGSVNQLPNGNVEFDMNAPGLFPIPNLASEVQEVTQTPTPQMVWKMDIAPVPLYAYRAYRVPSLYPGVSWRY